MNNEKKITKKKNKFLKFVTSFSKKSWPILLPFFIVIIFLIILPLIGIIIFSIIKPTGDSLMFQISFERFVQLFTSKNVMLAMILSIVFALVAALCAVVIAYPVALLMSTLKNKNIAKNIWILVTMPIWISAILKVLGLQSLFLVLAPYTLGTPIAVIIGMIYMFLPFAITPIYNSLDSLDRNYINASLDLGATKTKAFWHITFRHSLPGVLTAFSLVFVQSATSLLIVKYMGDGKMNLISAMIESYFFKGSDFGFGATISVVLAIFIFLIIIIAKLISNKFEVRRSKKWKNSLAQPTLR